MIMSERTRYELLNLFNLPVITNISEFSEAIGLSPALIYVLSENSEKYYKKFPIKKKDGSDRIIYSPCYSMKIVQKWILEEILYHSPFKSDCSYGFQKGVSSPLRENAKKHWDHSFLFKMDLKDFFPSITIDKVSRLFCRLGYSSLVANMMANICTVRNRLPQGAVTSPYISNLVCVSLDKRLLGYCRKREVTYTRYADDLTFSGNDKGLLKRMYPMLKRIIEDEGYAINGSKTQFISPKSHQSVTGVTINNHIVKAPKKMKRNVRAMIHRAIVTGDYSKRKQILGYIAYIHSIEDDYLQYIKSYIQHFEKTSITLFKNSVDAYNQNKFFSDLPDFTLLTAEDFTCTDETGVDVIDLFPAVMHSESLSRIELFKKAGITPDIDIVEDDEICSEEDWPF